jgi:hypothetical protein
MWTSPGSHTPAPDGAGQPSPFRYCGASANLGSADPASPETAARKKMSSAAAASPAIIGGDDGAAILGFLLRLWFGVQAVVSCVVMVEQ